MAQGTLTIARDTAAEAMTAKAGDMFLMGKKLPKMYTPNNLNMGPYKTYLHAVVPGEIVVLVRDEGKELVFSSFKCEEKKQRSELWVTTKTEFGSLMRDEILLPIGSAQRVHWFLPLWRKNTFRFNDKVIIRNDWPPSSVYSGVPTHPVPDCGWIQGKASILFSNETIEETYVTAQLVEWKES